MRAVPALPGWLQSRLPGERFRTEADGWSIHGLRQGSGTPVLFLHGNPTWSFLYRRVFRRLAEEPLLCVAPDLVGLGFSDKPGDPEIHRLDHHAEWIGGVVDGLGLDRFVLVGQDWGGPIGLRMAADRPESLAGMVLLNTVVGPPKEGFRPTLFHRFSRLPVVSTLVFRGLGFPQRVLHWAQGDRKSIRGAIARAYRYPLRGWRRRAAPLALARMVPDSLDHPAIPDLERCQELVESFRGPTEIVWGDRDPILGGVRSWIEKLLPEARSTRTDAGHFLQEEVPGAIADAVRRVALSP
ncbi:MAG: alpha/beta fold hydrolase [Thermoanaerobaculia bacterium]|nr:alpha/beta fold hydrolase [Thermoanaerobaculia bacterium]